MARSKGAPAVKRAATSLANQSLPGSAEHAEITGLPPTQAQVAAARLAQIVNLHIGGYSLAAIADACGTTADEIDRMLQEDVGRYVRNQPALRIFVRNWISEKYMKMIEADWDAASDQNHRDKLDNQDRVDRFLRSMAKLHGADAPVQNELKIDAAPEAVEKMVQALSAAQGLAYDESIFDAEVIEELHEQTELALEKSSSDLEAGDDDDEELAL
jgi:hypothetical protein